MLNGNRLKKTTYRKGNGAGLLADNHYHCVCLFAQADSRAMPHA